MAAPSEKMLNKVKVFLGHEFPRFENKPNIEPCKSGGIKENGRSLRLKDTFIGNTIFWQLHYAWAGYS